MQETRWSIGSVMTRRPYQPRKKFPAFEMFELIPKEKGSKEHEDADVLSDASASDAGTAPASPRPELLIPDLGMQPPPAASPASWDLGDAPAVIPPSADEELLEIAGMRTISTDEISNILAHASTSEVELGADTLAYALASDGGEEAALFEESLGLALVDIAAESNAIGDLCLASSSCSELLAPLEAYSAIHVKLGSRRVCRRAGAADASTGAAQQVTTKGAKTGFKRKPATTKSAPAAQKKAKESDGAAKGFTWVALDVVGYK